MQHIKMLITLMALSSCGSKEASSDAPEAAKDTSPEMLFQGTFNSDCQNMKKIMLKNSGTVSEMVVSEFFDSQCAGLKAKTRIIRSIVFGDKRNNGYYNVDIKTDLMELTLQYKPEPTLMTPNPNLYGYSDWAKDVTHDILGKAQIQAKGDVSYTVWQISTDDSMRFDTPIITTGRTADDRNYLTAPYVFTKA